MDERSFRIDDLSIDNDLLVGLFLTLASLLFDCSLLVQKHVWDMV
jgi:hypothetical protein